MELKFNIAIVGSGLTGSITSLALAKAGYKVALIDPKSFEVFKENNYDTRTTALSKKSKLFFELMNAALYCCCLVLEHREHASVNCEW